MDPVFGFPGLIRFSWSTCEKLLKECSVFVKWYVTISGYLFLDDW